ncbi:hypothetical protein FA95DRAFT_1604826 [Auriscalpium vulgare]|uniref:Uncharacterized protein n=1 Tax=Auriscalpium vulgare TaxID=40419 RepID=A0ACB8RYF5_9AGAM|nr:hypothetical protein FA95DRAFT_1604826 [Auriscalpium vulgare]
MASQSRSVSNTSERQRTVDSVPAVEDIESPDLWFDDGNIIIRAIAATDTTPSTRTMYKLHKFVLARHCSVFALLFEGPQDAFAAASEHRDGLPVMDLTDQPEELRSFLKALYLPGETHIHCHPSSVPFDDRWTLFPALYYGILRLAFKYDASDIQDVVLPVFKAQWPSKLAGWDQLQVPDPQAAPPQDTLMNVDYVHPDPVSAIRLAVECNISHVLPLAYYSLACLLATAEKAHRARITSDLTLEEGRIVFLGFLSFGDVLDLSEMVDDCPHLVCGSSITQWYRQILDSGYHITDPLGWFRWALTKISASTSSHMVCMDCRTAALEWLQQERLSFWRSLPGMFGLEDVVSTDWGSTTEI